MRNLGVVGTTHTIGPDPNEMVWRVAKDQARRFEQVVATGIRNRIASNDISVRVAKTPLTGDQGRDIEIEFSRTIEIAGCRFSVPEGKPSGRIYVECKASEDDRLNDGFLSDASQHETGEFDFHVLATNATITPSLHYRASVNWSRCGAKFYLLDRWRLWNWLFESGVVTPIGTVHPHAPSAGTPNRFQEHATGLVLHLLSHRERNSQEHLVRTYLVVRNYSPVSQSFSISTASELSWDSDVELQAVLEPYEDRAYRFRSRQQIFGYDAELTLKLTSTGRSTSISLKAPHCDLVLEPIFHGENHRAASKIIGDLVADPQPLKFVSVEGEAGVGKTRTIREALDGYGNASAHEVVWLPCRSDTGTFDFTILETQLRERTRVATEIDLSVPSFSTRVIESIGHLSLPVVLVLEDLHHCSADGIRELKQLILDPPSMSASCTVIFTGRNDFTFPNPDYFSFLELVHLNLDKIAQIKLEPLSQQDSHDLINSIVANLPIAAMERIDRLGQRNPFVIIEILQYLLDVGLSRLLSRRTTGIVDPERFVGATDLPDRVEHLYSLRFQSLSAAPHGHRAFDLLCLASLFGYRLSVELLEDFFDDEPVAPVLALLRQRRFLTFHPEEGSFTFTHENLLHAARNQLASQGGSRELAQRLSDNRMSSRLPEFQRGLLLALAGRDAEAFEVFSPIWNCLRNVTNFSSEEISREYFQYLPFLFDVAERLQESPDDLARVATTRGYMGVHNFPLYIGVQACDDAIEWISRIAETPEYLLKKRRPLRQLRAHALQNMGRTGEAFRVMLELKAELEVGLINDPPLEYDLYDRLQEHYRRANHRALMLDYGQLAARAVQLSVDDKLLSSHLITQSLASIHDGRKAALNMAQAALSASEKVGVKRFNVFNQLTVLVAEALYIGKDRDKYTQLYHQALTLLRVAVNENFSDSIIRLDLFLATLALQVYEDPGEARKTASIFIDSGREASVRYGIGFYGWAFENLRAVLMLNDDRAADEDISLAFQACLDHLQRRGLLFVGCADGTYPNVHAISNIVRYWASFSEKEACRLISSHITSYSMAHTGNNDAALKLALEAKSGRAILWPARSLEMLRYPAKNGFFTPIF